MLVGDADGIDSSIQKYFALKLYKKVKIYASQGKVRNNYGSWNVEAVEVKEKLTG